MNVIIFAGGNQTRFGIEQAIQPKVLYPLSQNRTILSNIVDQLEAAVVDRIIVCLGDKLNIAEYINRIKSDYKVPIISNNDRFSEIADYIFSQGGDLAPTTFIFGDTYFPHSVLTHYIKGLVGLKGEYFGVIGASPYPVGDYHIHTHDGCVVDLVKEDGADLYTCGVFSILNTYSASGLDKASKVTEVFRQLALKEKISYIQMDGLVDLDTQDQIKRIPINELAQ